MFNYKLTVAYVGSYYSGFQVQKNATTVQGELMRVAIEIFGDEVTVTGASRTDAGVHANGQVVLVKAKKQIKLRSVILAFNSKLDRGISIMDCEMVGDDWHPRYQKVTKTYSYSICNMLCVNPRYDDFCYHIKHKLDVAAMRKCADYLVGKHDFYSYSNASKINDSVRNIYSLEVLEEDGFITIVVKGDGFLYNMVRIIAGTLIECGERRRDEGDIKRSLNERNRKLTGATAPAKGLTLEKIVYE